MPLPCGLLHDVSPEQAEIAKGKAGLVTMAVRPRTTTSLSVGQRIDLLTISRRQCDVLFGFSMTYLSGKAKLCLSKRYQEKKSRSGSAELYQA